jgi:hypothetical protein
MPYTVIMPTPKKNGKKKTSKSNGTHKAVSITPDVEVVIQPLSDFAADPNNLNMHTPRGHSLLTREIEQHGMGRPMFATNDNVMKAGNLTQEVISEVMGGGAEAIVIRTRGDRPIIHQRMDLESDDPRAVEMGLADNWIAHVSFNLDPEGLSSLDPAIADRYFFADELRKIIDGIDFKEYDESVAIGISICKCPTCGHEHVGKNVKKD